MGAQENEGKTQESPGEPIESPGIAQASPRRDQEELMESAGEDKGIQKELQKSSNLSKNYNRYVNFNQMYDLSAPQGAPESLEEKAGPGGTFECTGILFSCLIKKFQYSCRNINVSEIAKTT